MHPQSLRVSITASKLLWTGAFDGTLYFILVLQDVRESILSASTSENEFLIGRQPEPKEESSGYLCEICQ